MMNPNCDPLALITAVNTLAVAIAGRLNDEELDLTAAILVQLGDTLATISTQRAICSR
ncbi:DUF6774 domain-containing protein [uncultured Oscillibacter sp.]|uniref:DUF6774 domain-containing protein n=1 Tax=uncultured Oscillibacter sp. TaxID=876091 RepID=UPI0026116BBD|nr:DUF6774 domain-containing protein [uncultured Oscillibacter sp.]